MKKAYITVQANGLDGYEDIAELWQDNGLWKYYLHNPDENKQDIEGSTTKFDSAFSAVATWAEEHFGVEI